MPDHPRSVDAEAGPPRLPVAPVRVRLTGIAVAHGHADVRLIAARRALDDARLDPRGLTAVISIGRAGASADSAAAVGRGLGLGGEPGLRVLDMIDDGCGVPSSIALGASILAQWGGAVLLTVDGGALVLGAPAHAVARPLLAPGVSSGVAGRRTADVRISEEGARTAVEQVLATVGDGAPIVAVVPGGLRLSPGRRFASVSLVAQRAATPIEGLLRARDDGYCEVVLVTADDRGRAAAVTCGIDGGGAGRRQGQSQGQRQ